MTINVSEVFTKCLLRDNHTCQDCGSTSNIEVHHILPISQGGKNSLANLKTVCFKCHRDNYKDVHYPKEKSKIIPLHEREKVRSGIDKSKKIQITLSTSDELKEAIDDYRFNNRISSRNAAILELIEKGLKQEKPSE